MPEGPEIRRAADNLEAAIKGKPLTDVWFAFPQLKPYQSQLIGQHVTHVETRGKALLTHFSNDLTLYSHNQLYGVWRVVDTGEEPQTTRVLRVKLQTADKTILLDPGTTDHASVFTTRWSRCAGSESDAGGGERTIIVAALS